MAFNQSEAELKRQYRNTNRNKHRNINRDLDFITTAVVGAAVVKIISFSCDTRGFVQEHPNTPRANTVFNIYGSLAFLGFLLTKQILLL